MIMYALLGIIDHGDSLGNRGTIGAGNVQWMTSGSGIIHQEMSHGDPQGRMHGLQLWAMRRSRGQCDYSRLGDRDNLRR